MENKEEPKKRGRKPLTSTTTKRGRKPSTTTGSRRGRKKQTTEEKKITTRRKKKEENLNPDDFKEISSEKFLEEEEIKGEEELFLEKPDNLDFNVCCDICTTGKTKIDPVFLKKNKLNKDVENFLELYEFDGKEDRLIETGILPLDVILGGGILLGAFYEVAGEPGCGKSTCMFHMARNLLTFNKDLRVLYVDVEQAVNNSLIKKLRIQKFIDERRLKIVRMNTFEAIDNLFTKVILDNGKLFDVIIVDSLTMLIPSEIENKEVEKRTVAIKARCLTSLLEKWIGHFRVNKIAWFNICQIRVKFTKTGLARLESSACNCIQHAADVRIWCTKGKVKTKKQKTIFGEREIVYAQQGEIFTYKNKITVELFRIPFFVLHGRGISNAMFIKDVLEFNGYLKRSGSYYEFNLPSIKEKIHGVNKLIDFIRENIKEIKQFMKENDLLKLVTEE